MRTIFSVLFLFLTPASGFSQALIEVIDGDTIEVDGETLRLFGIDAPEMKQICNDKEDKNYLCGEFAKKELMKIFGLSKEDGFVDDIDCTDINMDRYRRWVSVCFIGDINVGREMVRRGAALAYRQYSLSYEDDEDNARYEAKGIWQGDFIKPWEWRAKQHQ